MARHGLKWGLILGAAVAVWTLAVHSMGFYTTRVHLGLIADNVAAILPLTAVMLALVEHRRRTGSLTVRHAVTLGLIVGAASAPISVGFLWLYHHRVNPGWVDYLVEHAPAQGAVHGLSVADIETEVNNLRRNSTDAAQITAGLIGSIVICTLAGLAGGAVLWRRSARP